jgi:hypothetical protein
MKRIILASAMLTVALAPLPAHAQNGSLTRSFVSSSGQDTNACTVTAPCQSFAVAYTKISANGIITALDPGKYGPLTGPSAITGPVTINGNGWASITGPAGGTAITISAGPNDAVKLSGLELDGANVSTHGITFGSGGSLIIDNCVVRQFPYGIVLNATSAQVVLSNSRIENNTMYGLLYAPFDTNGAFSFDHVQFLKNTTGMSVQDGNLASKVGVIILATGTNSSALGNGIGFEATSTGQIDVSLVLDNAAVEGNATEGIHLKGNVEVAISRTVIANNVGYVGWKIEGGGTLFSAGNNVVWDSDILGQDAGSLTESSGVVE